LTLATWETQYSKKQRLLGFNLWFLESRLRPATFLHGLLQEIHNDFDWNQFALLEASLMGPKLAATTGLLEEYPYFFSVSMYEPIESNVLLFSYSLDFFRPGQPFQQNYQQSSGCFC
jgi:hypothetical protein